MCSGVVCMVCAWVCSGLCGPLGGWFKIESLVQDHSLYPTIYQPRRPQQTSMYKTFPILNFSVLILIMFLGCQWAAQICPLSGSLKGGVCRRWGWVNRPRSGLRIGLPESSAMRCAAFKKCCATQCRTPRETDSKASSGPICFKKPKEINAPWTHYAPQRRAW